MARRSGYLFPLICSALVALASAFSAVAHAVERAFAYAFPPTAAIRVDQVSPVAEIEIGRHEARMFAERWAQRPLSRWGPPIAFAA